MQPQVCNRGYKHACEIDIREIYEGRHLFNSQEGNLFGNTSANNMLHNSSGYFKKSVLICGIKQHLICRITGTR